MIIAGLGFRATATEQSLAAALDLLPQRPDALATLADKAQTPLFRRFATQRDLAIIALDAADIAGEDTPTQSPRILAMFHTGSIAEATALVAARQQGQAAKLICTRRVTPCGQATAALAKTEDP